MSSARRAALRDKAQPTSTDISRSFNPYLHGARGLFAFMIVVYHVVNSNLPTFTALSAGPALMLTRSLEHGVELFFGISGIVIVGALQRARGPLTFAIERCTRIYPVLWVSIGVLVILSGVTGYEGRTWPSFGDLVANLLALPPLLPGILIHPAAWSLSYELLFLWLLRARLASATQNWPMGGALRHSHSRRTVILSRSRAAHASRHVSRHHDGAPPSPFKTWFFAWGVADCISRQLGIFM